MRSYVLAGGGLAVVGVVTMVALSWACPNQLQRWGLDVWNLPLLTQRLSDANAARIELEQRDKAVLRRIAIKEEIVADVIGERLPLTEAAALFRELNTNCPEYLATLRIRYPQLSEDEIYCRNVIDFVAAALTFHPSRCTAVVDRLEGELRCVLQRDGLVKLQPLR